MATKKKGINNAEIANFIDNISSRFEAQRNTLNFLKLLGNFDAKDVIQNAAQKEVSFAIERMDALYKMSKEQAPLSDETIAGINNFLNQLCEQVKEDITIKGVDSATLIDELMRKLEEFK